MQFTFNLSKLTSTRILMSTTTRFFKLRTIFTKIDNRACLVANAKIYKIKFNLR